MSTLLAPRPRVALRYCPLHEWDSSDCDEWCAPRRDEMQRLDNALRKYFADKGYRFSMRWNG